MKNPSILFEFPNPQTEETRNKFVRRCRILARGHVQGVGFRPFVHKLAHELGLSGWIKNDAQGVRIEIEGDEDSINVFFNRMRKELPVHSRIHQIETLWMDAAGFTGFQILESDGSGRAEAFIQTDLSTCDDCLQDINNPLNRRHRYPFTNCTHCGPRFSMMLSLPYDRNNTTMKNFQMCAECKAEYDDPADRRFHAQPNACPDCGPKLELWTHDGKIIKEQDEALKNCERMLREGKIVAVKGLGGFHLMVDAANMRAVGELRQRKRRNEKPFAILAPSIEWVRRVCEISKAEEQLLMSAEKPIVLLKKRRLESPELAENIAPGNPYLGILLPYTPLHHILMNDLKIPLVATSGNLSEEPLCIDEQEAVRRLAGIADYFLVHNRPIARPVDDSIARVAAGREMLLRRARGFAPLSLPVEASGPAMMAVGAHLKSTVSLSDGKNLFMSQHLGNLETVESVLAFEQAQNDLSSFYEGPKGNVAFDSHPDYASTRHALNMPDTNKFPVQHHLAHAWSCMADNGISGPVLAIVWDGTGYGLDGTIWGGEFLRVADRTFERLGRLRPFPLPGSEAAVREPGRSALGMLYALYGDLIFTQNDWISRLGLQDQAEILKSMLKNKIQCPLTSSAGRIFDAVAALANLRKTVSFEAQAAMELEFAIGDEECRESYPFSLTVLSGSESRSQAKPRIEINWAPMMSELLKDIDQGEKLGLISARFHNFLSEAAIAMARAGNLNRVVLSGGCFQNKFLLERTIGRLRECGFSPYWHQRIPPNDGGISVGQIFAASHAAGA